MIARVGLLMKGTCLYVYAFVGIRCRCKLEVYWGYLSLQEPHFFLVAHCYDYGSGMIGGIFAYTGLWGL